MIQPRDLSRRAASWTQSFPFSFPFPFFFLLRTPSSPLPPSPPPHRPVVRDGLPAAGDVLLPEPGRCHGVRSLLPARPVRGSESGQRRSEPHVRCSAGSAEAQRIQETRTVPSAEARLLLQNIVHHQYM